MELRQLEAFAAVISTGSVTAAGRLLGRSQPAISRLVQELEHEIGYALFSRNGPRVTPTEQGFLLYEDVAHALQSLQHIRQRASEIAQGSQRPLSLLATPALAAGLVPQALAQMEAEAADSISHIRVRSASPEQVAHGVLTGAAQMGVSSLPLEHRGLQVHWIGRAACVAVLPQGDPLASLEVVPLAALAERRVITMTNPYRLRGRLDDAFAAARPGEQAGQTQFMETNASVNAIAAVRAGLGVSVLEPVTALGLPLQGVVVRPLDTEIPFLFGVVTQQAAPCTPAMDALCQTLIDVAQRLLPGFVLHDAREHAALLEEMLPHGLPPASAAHESSENHE